MATGITSICFRTVRPWESLGIPRALPSRAGSQAGHRAAENGMYTHVRRPETDIPLGIPI